MSVGGGLRRAPVRKANAFESALVAPACSTSSHVGGLRARWAIRILAQEVTQGGFSSISGPRKRRRGFGYPDGFFFPDGLLSHQRALCGGGDSLEDSNFRRQLAANQEAHMEAITHGPPGRISDVGTLVAAVAPRLTGRWPPVGRQDRDAHGCCAYFRNQKFLAANGDGARFLAVTARRPETVASRFWKSFAGFFFAPGGRP